MKRQYDNPRCDVRLALSATTSLRRGREGTADCRSTADARVARTRPHRQRQPLSGKIISHHGKRLNTLTVHALHVDNWFHISMQGCVFLSGYWIIRFLSGPQCPRSDVWSDLLEAEQKGKRFFLLFKNVRDWRKYNWIWEDAAFDVYILCNCSNLGNPVWYEASFIMMSTVHVRK